MVGVVRIYREQTKTVWVEVAHIWRTLKNASGLRVSDIDLVHPALKEEAITDPLDFTTETFRWDLDVHSIVFLGPEDYFTVNGNRLQSTISPPPPVGHFSPPSLSGTPIQRESPRFLADWRVPSGSDIDHSPLQARADDITIPEVDHVMTRQDEPIRIPDELDITEPPSPSQPQPRPDASRRSPRPRSRSPRARSRSPRRRSRSPLRRSRSPRRRSRSPRRRSRSPRARSRSPHGRSQSPRRRSRSPRSRQPRSPRLHTPTRPRDEQPPAGIEAPPFVPGAEPLDYEPSGDEVLIMDEKTGELILPEEPDLPDLPTSVRELAVPTGLVTPGVPVITAIPSPPKKRRRMPIDHVIRLSNEVIQRNVDTGGIETLCERRLDEHYLKSAKDLFMEPTTEALCSYPFLDLWKGNAVTTPEEYHSSDAGESSVGSPDLRRSPLEESIEAARRMETPSEKEILREALHPERSGLFERSTASTDFTPDLQDSGLKRDVSISSDRSIRPELDMEPTAPRGRSSSILRSSILLSPIHEPSDFEENIDLDLPTLTEQPEVTQLLEEQTNETWRLVTKAFGDSDEPVVFRNLWHPRLPSRKTAAKAFYHLLALHKEGVFELKQRDPYMLTNIYIQKGVNY